MKNLNYRIILNKEGGFTTTVPALPGCITFGENLEQAKKAIELYLEELQDRNEHITDDTNTLEYSLNLMTK